jgi:hypothetical protein
MAFLIGCWLYCQSGYSNRFLDFPLRGYSNWNLAHSVFTGVIPLALIPVSVLHVALVLTMATAHEATLISWISASIPIAIQLLGHDVRLIMRLYTKMVVQKNLLSS